MIIWLSVMMEEQSEKEFQDKKEVLLNLCQIFNEK